MRQPAAGSPAPPGGPESSSASSPSKASSRAARWGRAAARSPRSARRESAEESRARWLGWEAAGPSGGGSVSRVLRKSLTWESSFAQLFIGAVHAIATGASLAGGSARKRLRCWAGRSLGKSAAGGVCAPPPPPPESSRPLGAKNWARVREEGGLDSCHEEGTRLEPGNKLSVSRSMERTKAYPPNQTLSDFKVPLGSNFLSCCFRPPRPPTWLYRSIYPHWNMGSFAAETLESRC